MSNPLGVIPELKKKPSYDIPVKNELKGLQNKIEAMHFYDSSDEEKETGTKKR